jgi:3-hydroxyisobutyrate dehydrogenase
MHVAVLGTGIMGTGMAHSLLREGHQVTVWNRNATKAQALAADGATVAGTPQEAVAGAEAVLTILFDADAVLAVMAEALPAMGPDALWIQSSTIGAEGTARAARLAAEHGTALIDAPVLGTKVPAEKGQLVVLASGAPELRQRATPVFEAIGARTVWAGDEPGPATALKLVANAWVGSITAAAAQSVALAERLGLDPRLFLEAVRGGAADAPMVHAKGEAMLTGGYDPQFAVAGVVKDLSLIRAAAADSGLPTELLDVVASHYREASERGHADSDMAAVVTSFRD